MAKYKVGDIVTIKSWEQMAEEFGYNSEGPGILCGDVWFLNDMREYCGQSLEICKVRGRTEVSISYDICEIYDYYFTDDMIAGLAEFSPELENDFADNEFNSTAFEALMGCLT